MIRAEFCESNGLLNGFKISGHAGYAESGQDIVCAAVSSAVSLATNIITDGFHADAEASDSDGAVTLTVNKPDERTQAVLTMLREQLGIILEEFPKTIKITISEV